jgi:SAM-dependent methyltransferase/N-acetylglutamate synthase-like GNAT family acetyltransferase
MQCEIISIRSNPGYAVRAIDWFSSKWGIDRKEYEKSINDCISNNERLPRWYLAIGESDEIIGGCGLILNDFVDRTDLFSYLCALYVEEKARGHALGSKLLEYVRTDAGRLGFDKLYLCTDHTSYYEKYGWKHIGTGRHPWGETSRIYEAPSIGEPETPVGGSAAAIRKPLLEKMTEFFAARVGGYDEHMLNDVAGCVEGYKKMAELIPDKTETILDLGCGTGLELDEIFRRFPDVSVTGIDLTQAMLDRLDQKYHGRNIRLICGDYFKVDFGVNAYDAAVSFQTMHHFAPDVKAKLYGKIRKALKPGGVYIECDYMVEDQSEEDKLFAEYARLRREMNIPDGEYYHFDTPGTIDNQIVMLKKAGFLSAVMVWRVENTTIIVAKNGCQCIPGVR